MLSKGFSLVELLFALAISSLLMFGAMSFYPALQQDVLLIYQQNRMQETVNQAFAGLIKDVKRAGFIANDPALITEQSIEISAKNDCIITRYDAESTGKWRYFPLDSKNSDIFAYRYNKNNLEYRVGVPNCIGTGWEKLFDPDEIKVMQFSVEQHVGYIELNISTALTKRTSSLFKLTQLVGNINGGA